MVLYLLRHGDALTQGEDDYRRPLSAVGRLQAEIVGRYLAGLSPPAECILTSPLDRARQMGEIVGTFSGTQNYLTTGNLVPGSDESKLFREINSLGKASLLLVGHEPHLRSLLSSLVAGSANGALEMRKSSLACVQSTMPVGSGSGSLRWLLTVELMKAIVGEI